ncbi:DnaD domain protein [Lactiplantibacillus paraxiangfangensis]|uniref:DnaD domain-containing protein n=1 Tax=Lactiplantibacillus paraxiangfangensis TaxID=3076224 RepID=UPI0030C73C9A
MAKIRKLAQTNYTVIDNQIIRDETLSWKAKGVFAYLWSMPENWDFYETEVMTHAKDGRDALRSAIKELQVAGYMRRQRTRNEKGQVKTSDWELSDKPMLEKPTQDKPTKEKPMQDDPTLPSTNGLSTDLPITNGTNDDDEGHPQTDDPIKKSWVSLWTEPNAVVSAQLREWSQNLNPELVCFAIQVAGEHSVKVSGALKYLTRVIEGWQKRKITTLEQAKKAAAEHDKRSQHKSKSSKGYKNREVKPKWLKDQEDGYQPNANKSKVTDQQRKELEERVKRLDSKSKEAV